MRCNFCGSFYPANKEELLQMLDDAFFESENHEQNYFAGIAPHAGYVFSLSTAMKTHVNLLKNFSGTIAILSPSHTGFGDGTSKNLIETPLGKIEPDSDLIDSLKIPINDHAVYYEHAIEIHLPIIQYLQLKFNRRFKFLPFVINVINERNEFIVKELVKLALQDKIKIIISSDFIHFGYNYDFVPFTKNVDENFQRLNLEIIDKIIKIQPQEFLRNSYTVCGKYPIFLFLKSLKEFVDQGYNIKGILIEFTDSSRVMRDFDRVGYASILFEGGEKL